jgi:hypothetical protein
MTLCDGEHPAKSTTDGFLEFLEPLAQARGRARETLITPRPAAHLVGERLLERATQQGFLVRAEVEPSVLLLHQLLQPKTLSWT